MSTNRPTTKELAEAVREFLENRIQPSVDAHTSFHTRVAVNVLKIIERELELGPELDAEEHERLRRLLDQEGTLKELNSLLCQKLRDGSIDYKNEALVDHFRKTTMGRLSIDNPRYSAYKKALKEAGG
jgi:3-methyladenine DNA glycosylase AlkD